MRGHPSRKEPWWASSGPITGCHSHHLLVWWSKHSEHLSLVSHSTCRPGTSQNTVEWPDIYLLSRASLRRIVRRPFSEGTLLYLVYSYSKVRYLILLASSHFLIYKTHLGICPAVALFSRDICVDTWELVFSIYKVKSVWYWCVEMS